MSEIEYSDRELYIDDQIIELEAEIRDVIQRTNKVIVRMSAPRDIGQNNVVCYTEAGERLWEIEEPPEDQGKGAYHGIQFKAGKLIAYNMNSYMYEVDTETGAVEMIKYTGK